ncbi:phosphotransferase [Actinoplanes sp. URMC 104]|uniref:phosphotransferase n=1 Tax=Actinoplanes sp. URMC 104 TaxID=3423409 RepID=UPI003F1CCFC0
MAPVYKAVERTLSLAAKPEEFPPLPRLPWHKLPRSVRAAVERRTGPILRVRSVDTGAISDVAAVLETDSGFMFCKGAAADNPMGWMHRNEARINPHLPAPAPRLQWQVDHDGWLLLGFDHVDGRHPDLSPGSSDLPAVAAALSEMATTLTPCPPVKVQAATARWADWIPPDVVDGDTLVHTDVTPFNFLIHSGGVTVVDWSMPCRGAPWIDTALMVIRLIRAGHRPEQAEAWADQIAAWSGAEPESLDAFAAGIAMLSRVRQSRQPSSSHLGPLADAAECWATYRAGASIPLCHSDVPAGAVMKAGIADDLTVPG